MLTQEYKPVRDKIERLKKTASLEENRIWWTFVLYGVHTKTFVSTEPTIADKAIETAIKILKQHYLYKTGKTMVEDTRHTIEVKDLYIDKEEDKKNKENKGPGDIWYKVSYIERNRSRKYIHSYIDIIYGRKIYIPKPNTNIAYELLDTTYKKDNIEGWLI